MKRAATETERLEDRCLLVPSLSLQDLSFAEGNDGQGHYTHNVQVNLSEPAGPDGVTVFLNWVDGTAKSVGSELDYTGADSGIFIPLGATTWSVGVYSLGDFTVEPDETFTVRVIYAEGATIADGEAVVTILNDDTVTTPAIAINDVTQVEGNSGSTTFTFQVTLSAATTNTVTVNYATADATALAGSDYTATSGTLTFSPGTTSQTVTVTVLGDTVVELNEGFAVNLSNPVNGTLLGPLADDQGTGLIMDDDAAPPEVGVVRLKAIKPTAAERSTAADGSLGGVQLGEFVATLDFAISTPLTVNVTVSGSATLSGPGQDYNLSSMQLTIPAGATTSSPIIVTPIADEITDPNETVIATLGGGSIPYSVYAGYESATVKILEYGTRLLRPEDGDNLQSYTFTMANPSDDHECGCIGGTEAPKAPVTESVTIEHSNRAARPRVTHFLETVVSPNANPTNTSTPSQQRLVLEVKNRADAVVLSRSYFFSLTGKSVGDAIRMGVESDVSSLATGNYSFEYQLTTLFADGTESTTELIGVDEGIRNAANLLGGLPNRASRPDYGFGDGWSVPGLKQARESNIIVPPPLQGIELTLSSGEALWFQRNLLTSTPATITYVNPRGFFGPGLIKIVATGRFYLTDKYRTVSEFSSAGYLLRETDRNGRITNYSYDGANNNRLSGVLDSYGKGFSVTYGANGFVDALTDREGRSYSLNFDASTGRLSSITPPDPDGASGGTAPLRTAFNYDAQGRMTARTTRKMDGGSNPLQENTQFIYDSRGHLIEEWHYDELVDGQPAEWTFAPVEAFPDIVDGSIASAATISNPAPLMQSVDITSITSIPLRSGPVKMTYDWANWPSRYEEFHDGSFLVTLYQYDTNGLLIHETQPTVTLPGGGTQTLEYDYSYDTNGNLEEVTTLSNAYPGGVGPTRQWNYDPNFSQLTYFTDELGRTQQTDVHWTGSGANGNTVKIYDPVPLGANGGSWITDQKFTDFTYFADGTPQAGLVQKMTLPDPDGASGPQQRSERRFLYSWDHRNRLTKVEYRNSASGPATKIVANTYDAFDRRVMKQVDDNGDGTFDRTERYVWDGGQISLVLDANGAVLHRFLHGPAIDQVFADEDSVNGLLWDLEDNQNTTRDVINNSGTVVNHVTYSPFGVIASESDATKTPFAAYTGRDWDEDLQLQYNRGRWYEPATGRWLSEDPIRFGAGDANLQRYVENGPTNFTDPTGLLLIAIDGTSSRAFRQGVGGFDAECGRYRSHVRNFFEDYVSQHGEDKYYFDGPDNTTLGGDALVIRNRILGVILPLLQNNPSQPVVIIGHSRGGLIAIEVARALRRAGYAVDFMGLYDPVDMTPSLGDEGFRIPNERIPSNVKRAAVVLGRGVSRWYFNRIDGGREGRSTVLNQFHSSYGTHSGLGGAPGFAPWHDDLLIPNAVAQDRRESRRADDFIRSKALEAGVSVGPPKKIPFSTEPPTPGIHFVPPPLRLDF